MSAWLLKTEPSAYSFQDLERKCTDSWDGVANATAQIHLRTARQGDRCVIYHTGSERQAVGLATVVREAYPDPYVRENPKLVAIDVKAGERLARPVPLDRLKVHPLFAESPLVRIGRLSVVPLTDEQYLAILDLAGRD